MELSIVVNLHNEGILAYPTLRSVVAAVNKIKNLLDITCEILLVIDNGNKATLKVCNKIVANNLNLYFIIHKIKERDLALSRNYATQVAKGKYLSFIDGDDLWGEDWLLNTYLEAQKYKERIVWHPEVNIIFGKENHVFYHTDMDDEYFELEFLRLANYWTALTFSERDIYLQVPYIKNKIKDGFGFEDWNWNCNTIFHGIKHKVVKDTCHFIRRKIKDSIRFDSITKNALMSPSILFKANYKLK